MDADVAVALDIVVSGHTPVTPAPGGPGAHARPAARTCTGGFIRGARSAAARAAWTITPGDAMRTTAGAR